MHRPRSHLYRCHINYILAHLGRRVTCGLKQKPMGGIKTMMQQTATLFAIVLLAGLWGNKPTCAADAYLPEIDPAQFSSKIDNVYFKMPVGKKMIFEAKSEDGLERIEVEIINEQRTIMGVETQVYWDRVWKNGQLREETKDYLAQDKAGNVWYFGEAVDNFENGKLKDHRGAWLAGTGGALPGIWMKAAPKIGEEYRQEFLKGEAEDMGRIVSTGETVTITAGTFSGCIKTLDWSPLDGETKEQKTYCPKAGGLVLEEDLVSGERMELIEIIEAAGHNP